MEVKTHHHNGVLDESFGANQLVVAGVVDHVQDTGLSGAHWPQGGYNDITNSRGNG